MSTASKTSGISLALAAAALFAGLPAPSPASGDSVRCFGVNDCRGRGTCATAHNQCAGQNACRGQGVLDMSREACETAEGRIEE